jgi:predicted DNA-binding protein
MKTINLSPEIASRLSLISQQIGKGEDKLVEEAILNYLEELEDIQDAQERLSHPPHRYFSLEEVEQELGLVD